MCSGSAAGATSTLYYVLGVAKGELDRVLSSVYVVVVVVVYGGDGDGGILSELMEAVRVGGGESSWPEVNSESQEGGSRSTMYSANT